MEQNGAKILSADVLNRIEEVLNAKIGRINRCFGPRQKTEMITQFGAGKRCLLGFGWLTHGRGSAKQIHLCLVSLKPRLKPIPGLRNLRADSQQLVAKLVEF
ncbi:MAG: hypothetical protein WA728_01310 [Xanthobacteraceae bacterium]